MNRESGRSSFAVAERSRTSHRVANAPALVEGQASTYRYKRHSMHQQLPVIVAVVRRLPRELRAREGESASSTQKRARRRRSAATEARGCREQDDERTVILLPDFCAPPLWPFSIASTCGRGTGGPVSCRTRTRDRARERERKGRTWSSTSMSWSSETRPRSWPLWAMRMRSCSMARARSGLTSAIRDTACDESASARSTATRSRPSPRGERRREPERANGETHGVPSPRS